MNLELDKNNNIVYVFSHWMPSFLVDKGARILDIVYANLDNSEIQKKIIKKEFELMDDEVESILQHPLDTFELILVDLFAPPSFKKFESDPFPNFENILLQKYPHFFIDFNAEQVYDDGNNENKSTFSR